MNSVIFSLERKTFLFAGMGFAILMLIVLFCAFAVGNGSANRSHMVEAQTAFTADVETRLGKWRADLEAIEASGSAPSPYEARPMNIRLPVTLPPSPLADFAIGASDLHPSMTTVTTWSNQADLFSGYEFSNPSVLGIGRFDLAFVVAVLLPLLMIVASFDAAAGDRDRGLARMTAAQPVRFPNLVWTRLLLRNLYIWAAFLAIVLAVAVFNPGEADPGQRLARFALWAAAALLYGVFWFALIGFVVAVARKGEAVAASLFALWAVFVFAVPAIAGAAAEALYPPPSRLAYLSEMRAAEGDANREADKLTKGFLADHPDLSVSDEEVPGYFSSNFLANLEVEKRTGPVLDAFVDMRAKRRRLIDAVQYLSPSLIASNTLTMVAGGDAERHLHFQDQARQSLSGLAERIGPAIVARRRISLAEFDAIPRYTFEEQPLRQLVAAAALPLAFLALVAFVLLAAARRRLNAPLEKLL